MINKILKMTTMTTETRFNIVKLQLLSAIAYLNEKKIIANSTTIIDITGMEKFTVRSRLYQMTNLLNISFDKKHHNGCTLKYKLNETGKRRLNLLLDRMLNGYDLKLQKKPEPYDWTGFVLLPGLVEEVEENE